MRRDEWCFKWATLAMLAGVTLAVCTAAPGDGLRYWLQQWVLEVVG